MFLLLGFSNSNIAPNDSFIAPNNVFTDSLGCVCGCVCLEPIVNVVSLSCYIHYPYVLLLHIKVNNIQIMG